MRSTGIHPAIEATRETGAFGPRLEERFLGIRAFSEKLTEGLLPEDFVVQSMTDVSPLKWHLAHTTWFFEYFVLLQHAAGYRPLDPRYHHLFNSYYVQAGERHCRAQRGYLSRPTVREVLDYRAHVDDAMTQFLMAGEPPRVLAELVELGLHHEQQHQELILTDLKHVFSVNPLRPEYRPRATGAPRASARTLRWIENPEGLREVGAAAEGFSFDNERPRHRVYLKGFALADRLATCGEFLEFMKDGGYERADLWMSDGWAVARERGWTEPFYWEKRDGEWWVFTLTGMRRVEAADPVCHLSWYEADAFARWAGARLPTEFEWEVVAADLPVAGNLVEAGHYHPIPATDPALRTGSSPTQMFGDLWEWTGSSYRPYPGFIPAPGAIGEYNGKFMSNQFVLRGGSCATSGSHLRATYRNFFHPDACWQFSGVRLAKDVG
ncbi:MAG: ergothioneine biosynthesis protein EgtB [Gemmatimonadota bacterium]